MATTITIRTRGLDAEKAAYFTHLLSDRISQRAEVRFNSAGADSLILTLGIEPGPGAEGFRIAQGSAGEIEILGHDQRGLLYGIGKFLRDSSLGEKDRSEFLPGTWRGVETPARKVRGIYFATHFRNFYHRAPLPEIERYIEDLALWGYNAVTVWFDLHHFPSIADPEAQAMIVRLHAILSAARRLGLDTGLLVLANEAFDGSPAHLRADWTAGHDGYFRELYHYHVELCPSKPEAFDLLLEWRKAVFEAFADVRLDTVWIWPYDQGGCTCAACAPWGANGYLSIARPVADLARSFFPEAKIILSTWLFDHFCDGEWAAFARQIQHDPGWVDYLMAEAPGQYPTYLIHNGVPADLPLLGFPEISMFQSNPWGGYGANPLPGYIEKMWSEAGAMLAGGYPYSEGIFEDINKAVVAGFYWRGGGQALDTLSEYARYAFSARWQEEITEAMLLLEKGNARARWQDGQPQSTPQSNDAPEDEQFVIADTQHIQRAWDLLCQVDVDLHPAARASWRWRILYLRGMIDHALAANQFRTNAEIEAAFEELIAIYHAQDAIWPVKPPARTRRDVGLV
jgi:hypothetical protein